MERKRITSVIISEDYNYSCFYHEKSFKASFITDAIFSKKIDGEFNYTCYKNLENIYYNGSIKDWCKLELSYINCKPLNKQHNIYILDKNGNIEYNGYKYSLVTDLIIPNGVKKIGDYQFSNFKNITNVLIPKSVKSIGSDAFYNCRDLKNVYYDGSIEDWCNISFGFCLSSPMRYASNFYYLDENGSVEFNGNKYSLLTELIIPNTVKKLGRFQFCGFDKLKSVYISKSVKQISSLSFSCCKNLKRIVVDEENPRYDSRNNCNAIMSKNSGYLVIGCKNTIIPNNTNYIAEDAFYGCERLKELILPDSVEEIDNYAFESCRNLENVTLPKEIYLGVEGFLDCPKIKNVYYNGTPKELFWHVVPTDEWSYPVAYNPKVYVLDEKGNVEYNGKKYTLIDYVETMNQLNEEYLKNNNSKE